MHRPGRNSSRHMKGRQVALTLYLPPAKYWLLKAVSERSRTTMQTLLRRSLDEILVEEHGRLPFLPAPLEAGSERNGSREGLRDSERSGGPEPLSAP